ncbi:MAG: HDOD domain-containing protein [Verrucomicrobia bacterium]|nr:HDOD domain-containing protein [Verrucomicrobiota bacterium]
MLASPIPRESLLHVVKTLPAAPQILSRLGQLLLDLDSELEDIVAMLRRDTALTALIMRVANSAAFNPGVPFASMEEALARVGLSEVYRLTGFAAVAQLADRNLALYGYAGAQLRENSLLTGLVMEALARKVRVDPRMAYTAGLLRSTGKIALDRLTRFPGQVNAYGRVDYVSRGKGPLAAWETDFVGLSNCEAAAIILECWHFPERTIAAIRDHYAPQADSPPLATLLNLAAGAAERCRHGLPGEHFYWGDLPEKLAFVGLDSDALDQATRHALQVFGPIRAALG